MSLSSSLLALQRGNYRYGRGARVFCALANRGHIGVWRSAAGTRWAHQEIPGHGY